jgi:predicted TIM-barrel fold metal-dependent hydrolase
MRDGRRIVDTDTHQMEPADVWVEWIAPAFRDRAPRLQPGGRSNLVEGETLTAEGKYPFHSPEFIAALARGMQRFQAAREAGFSPASRLADMDAEGVDVQIIYPTVGGQLLGREFKDPELLAACCRAYNDWSAAYCDAAPARLRWAAMLPLQAPALAIAEARSRSMSVRIRSRDGTSTIATTSRSGPRSSGSRVRSASTTRDRRTSRPTASGWTRTRPGTSSRIRSRRWAR